MSVEYYFGCSACRRAIHVAQDGLSGFTFYSGEPKCMKALGAFLARHALSPCTVTLVSENIVDAMPYRIERWNE